MSNNNNDTSFNSPKKATESAHLTKAYSTPVTNSPTDRKYEGLQQGDICFYGDELVEIISGNGGPKDNPQYKFYQIIKMGQAVKSKLKIASIDDIKKKCQGKELDKFFPKVTLDRQSERYNTLSDNDKPEDSPKSTPLTSKTKSVPKVSHIELEDNALPKPQEKSTEKQNESSASQLSPTKSKNPKTKQDLGVSSVEVVNTTESPPTMKAIPTTKQSVASLPLAEHNSKTVDERREDLVARRESVVTERELLAIERERNVTHREQVINSELVQLFARLSLPNQEILKPIIEKFVEN